MIDKPQIIQTTAQPTAIIHLTIQRDEIQKVMGPGLQELMSAVADQAISTTGPWFTHHLKITPGEWDFEISVPVNKPVRTQDRVKPALRPALKIARTVYHGGYANLDDAWSEFMDWIESNGHASAPDLYECYLTGPESSPDPANWRTELTKPLIS